jgi:xylulokinase
MSILGLDIGTSRCKASVVDYQGNIIGQASREYSLINPKQGWEELDPLVVWNSVKTVIREAIKESINDPVISISVSSFGEASVPVDVKGNVLHNSIMYIDSRGKEEADYLVSQLGRSQILSVTGVNAHSMYGICKIMWLKKNKPEVFQKTWKFLHFADYILFQLGAGPHTDYSLAARTMAFNIISKKWSSEILDCAGMDEKIFGKPVQAGTIVGNVSQKMAEELNLSTNVKLVAGGHDQPCAALGAGVIKGGFAVDGLGTTECITPAFDHPIISDTMAESSFACVPHVVKDLYVTYAFTFTSGSVLKWYRDNFGTAHTLGKTYSDGELYDLLIERASDKASEIFILPHFAGAATPYMDTESKGAIVGLNINTRAEEIIKAILEGITYEIMVNVDKLKESGIDIKELRAVGGLSQSDKFLQLKADMMGCQVSTLQISEAGTLGVAILAGTACGIYKDIDDAVKCLVKKKKEFYPNPKNNEIYKEKFEIYKRIYPLVKKIF